MSEQLPPVEPVLRRQLTRRSSGSVPSGLVAETLARLDSAPRRRWSLRVPRVVVALGSMTAVVLLAAALVLVPALRTSPVATSSYPADRALTTDELANVMSGPDLPVNTVLVAAVTVDMGGSCAIAGSRGVVSGTSICVDDRRIVDYKAGPVTATWAFRYMQPNLLRIVSEVQPRSGDRLSFAVTDEWPATSAFVVRGYLGALGSSIPCPTPVGTGTAYTGYVCPYTSWLGDEPTAPQIEDKVANGWTYGEDQLSLRGTARYLEDGDTREVDSITRDKPVFGVYVIQEQTGTCSALSPVDSRGCNAWRLLAKVPELSTLTTPSPTPASPSAARSVPVLTDYPANRALTTAEVADLMAGPELAVNTTFVAAVTIQPRNDVCPMNRAPTIGVLEGMGGQVCVMDQGSGVGASQALTMSGTYVFEYWAPGYVALLAQLTTPAADRLSYQAGEPWPATGAYVVDAYVHRDHVVGNDPNVCPGQSPDSSGNVNCATYWLSDTGDNTSAFRFDVQLNDPNATYPEGHAFVLLSGSRMLALIDANPFEATTRPTPTLKPTSDVPATPVPQPTALILPSAPAGAAPLGLWGSGNRPFTVAELPALFAADPQHLANRIVIVKGPVPAGYLCWSAGQADSGISPPPCHIGVQPSQIAADGHYWAVKVDADGNLSVLGEIRVPASGGFVFTVDQLFGSATPPSGSFLIVDGWLGLHADAPSKPGILGTWSRVSPTAGDQSTTFIELPQDAYAAVTGRQGDAANLGPPIRGLFLIELAGPDTGTLLAQLSTVQP